MELRSDKQRNFDRISNLPDSLLSQILSYLSTQESVSTSVLSKRWRNLWLQVPVMELDFDELDLDLIRSFLDRFVGLENKQHLEKFKLIYEVNEHDDSRFNSWINAVINPRICHLHVEVQREYVDKYDVYAHMPMSVYSCERLVTLNLCGVFLDHPESISLPRVKILHLNTIKWEDDSTLKLLISSCPVLEELTIISGFVYPFCVRSTSLKNLKLECDGDDHPKIVVEIDAPGLEYMSIINYRPEAFVVHRIGPSSKIYIDFIRYPSDRDDSSNITMIKKFFTVISTASDMTVSSDTLEIIRDCYEMGTLPQFSNLSRLEACFKTYMWKMLPSFLENFPNLKSFILEFKYIMEREETEQIDPSCVPQCFISSLEFVHLKVPYSGWYQGEETSLTRKSFKLKLAKCFLDNCPALKKLTLCERFLDNINEIKQIPRSSTMCEVVMEELR